MQLPQNRLSISALVFFGLMVLAGLYFAIAAVQGPSGILRRVQIESETAELVAERDALQADVDRMKNLTRRLSDDYLDLDLLDERARDVLGVVRGDEVLLKH
ncbi:MAG: septum formation initiator precursor [Paracoccus denitrificans]|nr:MAG: septum formation initiator precursor [Paracoccus denitrificans]PZO86051.1 MAG: septum formation initiator precursor [Paracoccus denitrificans]